MPWVDTETGELSTECPHCESTRRDCEIQMSGMERDLRGWRSKATRAENAVEAAAIGKRDGKVWKEALDYWCEQFPGKRITSKGIKSARATKFFQRLEAGAGPEDIMLAIDGAKALPYIVYGVRRPTGPATEMRIDLEHIVSVGNDAQFDALVAAGTEARKSKEGDLF